MYKNKKILALIPARGGSKGLPGKNIKVLLGRPLIAWAIESAKKNKYIDRIIVSTDSEDIAEISKKYGAEVPFIRPEYLALDKSKMIDIIIYALNYLEEKGDCYDLVLLLQPTSPLRIARDIDESIKLLFTKRAKAVVSVSQINHYWSNTLPENGCMKDFLKPELLNKNRQELPILYEINGAIYLAYCRYLKKNNSFFGNETYAYKMPVERSIDIDTEFDFKIAQFLIKNETKKISRLQK